MGMGTGKNLGSGGSGSGFGGRGSGSRQGHVGHRRRHQAYRTGGDRRPGLVGQPPGLRRQLEPARLPAALQRQDLHRASARFPPMPARRRWASCPSLPPGKRTSPKATLQGTYPQRHRLAHPTAAARRQPGQGRGQQMMYSHGLATIALCEAYGLTGDRQVGPAAQGAVNFILNAQNPADGGWRYNPRDPGDTSVVGWQLMALKSAHMAGLNVGGSVVSQLQQVARFGRRTQWHGVLLPARPGGLEHDDLGRAALPPVPRRQSRQPHAYRRHGLFDEPLARRAVSPTSTTGTTQPRSCTTWAGTSGTPGTARCAICWSTRRSAMSMSVPTVAGRRRRTIGASVAAA